ncbi:MAG TPA: NYN domain-containing protein, partial [Streptosporangiaceae bacterium]|nr:NYN domain-containing protein [Streptosporangiaceae bacterium]
EPEGLPGTEVAQASPGQLRRLPSRPSSPAPLGPMGSPPPGPHSGPVSPRTGPYSGPQPIATSPPPGYQSVGGVSLVEAVQAAHEEGQEFGASVARDAPALWLEAVLARKPRMPSDLEARLLQGSALPIDFLLHDEVRHALRRGFWDSLERTRR